MPDEVAQALAEHPVKAVLLTHSETSTGVIQPLRDLARVANEAGALVVADVVSSLGAVPFAFDEWGIDVAVGGSQKALSASPGLAFVAISERAWAMHRSGDDAPVLLRLVDLQGLRRAARSPRTRGPPRSA